MVTRGSEPQNNALRLVEVLGNIKRTLEWAVEKGDNKLRLAVAEAIFVSLTFFC